MHVYRRRVNSGGQEKGVDVGLALDPVQATYEQRYEVAIIESQNADFGPAVLLTMNIARVQGGQAVFRACLPRGAWHAPEEARGGSRHLMDPNRSRDL